jgi:hypothetical protein
VTDSAADCRTETEGPCHLHIKRGGCAEGAARRKGKGKIMSIVQHLEEDRRGKFWGGVSVIHVDSKGKSFQVGLKKRE